jgi:hypothetical protein
MPYLSLRVLCELRGEIRSKRAIIQQDLQQPTMENHRDLMINPRSAQRKTHWFYTANRDFQLA